MTESGLPCLDLLEATPEILRGLMTELTEEDARKTTLELPPTRPAGAGDRLALHKEYGEITMSQMLNEWALHDLGHIRQIAELARARKYQAGAGPMAASYSLKP